MPAVFGRRSLRDRIVLPVRKRAARQHKRRASLCLTAISALRPKDMAANGRRSAPFGDLYYTYQVSLDLKVEEGWAIRTEPHPRFYTDPTDTTPIAVPALIRRWWPMIYFLVFKSPPEGKTHIFRPGEPFAQMLIVPEEAASTSFRCRRRKPPSASCSRGASIRAAPHYRPRREWTSATNTVFDGTYRHILGAASEKAKRQR